MQFNPSIRSAIVITLLILSYSEKALITAEGMTTALKNITNQDILGESLNTQSINFQINPTIRPVTITDRIYYPNTKNRGYQPNYQHQPVWHPVPQSQPKQVCCP